MEYLYYPGCSLKGQAAFYEASLLASFEKLGIPLKELPDWNCCGATSYMAVDSQAAMAMAARNLAIAEDLEQDVIAPCRNRQNHPRGAGQCRPQTTRAAHPGTPSLRCAGK